MKKRTIIDNTRHFAANAQRKAEREEAAAREQALLKLHEIWDEWKKRVVIQSRTVEELPNLLNELVWRAQQALTGKHEKDMVENFTKMVDHNLAQTFKFVEFSKLMIKVLADCPNHRPKTIGVDPDDGPNSYECGWGGMMYLPRAKWDEGTFTMDCPQCSNKLRKADMIPADQSVVNKSNQAVRFKPKHMRGSPILKSDIFEFLNTDQLLAFNWVQVHAKKAGFVRFAKNNDGDIFAVFKHGPERIGRVKFPDAVNLESLTPAPAAQHSTAAPLPQADPGPAGSAGSTGSGSARTPAVAAEPSTGE